MTMTVTLAAAPPRRRGGLPVVATALPPAAASQHQRPVAAMALGSGGEERRAETAARAMRAEMWWGWARETAKGGRRAFRAGEVPSHYLKSHDRTCEPRLCTPLALLPPQSSCCSLDYPLALLLISCSLDYHLALLPSIILLPCCSLDYPALSAIFQSHHALAGGIRGGEYHAAPRDTPSRLPGCVLHTRRRGNGMRKCCSCDPNLDIKAQRWPPVSPATHPGKAVCVQLPAGGVPLTVNLNLLRPSHGHGSSAAGCQSPFE